MTKKQNEEIIESNEVQGEPTTNPDTENTSEPTSTEEEVERVKDAEVAKEIEKILVENQRGIQPFLRVTEIGIVPSVRIVRTQEAPNEEVSGK